MLYGVKDPKEIFVIDRFMELIRKEESYILELLLPFTEKENLELGQKGGELILSVKNERRKSTLLNEVKGKDIVKAKMERDRLKRTFS